MNKLILPILLIVGVLLVSGCTQGGDQTQPADTSAPAAGTQPTDSGTTASEWEWVQVGKKAAEPLVVYNNELYGSYVYTKKLVGDEWVKIGKKD